MDRVEGREGGLQILYSYTYVRIHIVPPGLYIKPLVLIIQYWCMYIRIHEPDHLSPCSNTVMQELVQGYIQWE